jgi:crossover junction endodeoxyribonuclease RuvC
MSDSPKQPAVLGIDPGFSGGLAALTPDGEVVLTAAAPVTKGKGSKTELDVPALVALVRGLGAGHEVRLAVVERVGPMPGQGLVSTFTFGRRFAEVLGALKALGLPLELPLPQAWKRVVLAGTDRGKAAAVADVGRRFPAANLLATPRSKKPSDGIAEAVSLAEFGRRMLAGQVGDVRGAAASSHR